MSRGFVPIVKAMEENLEEPLSSGELAARRACRSGRWKGCSGASSATTARALYQHLRLERAERLLEYGGMSVREVAVACGYSSLAAVLALVQGAPWPRRRGSWAQRVSGKWRTADRNANSASAPACHVLITSSGEISMRMLSVRLSRIM